MSARREFSKAAVMPTSSSHWADRAESLQRIYNRLASPPRADQEDEIKTTVLTKALDAAAVEIEGWGAGNEADIVRAASKRLAKLEHALATKRSDADV